MYSYQKIAGILSGVLFAGMVVCLEGAISNRIEYVYHRTKIILDYGSIEKQNFVQEKSAIVNAANMYLQGGGGVDKAIHAVAGGQDHGSSVNNMCKLCLECRKLTPHWRNGDVLCPTGESRITSACKLAEHGYVSHIIHTVGPCLFHGAQATEKQEKQLAGTYINSLKVAKLNGIQAVAFPQISVGIFNYPLEQGVVTAIKNILIFIKKNPDALQEIRLIMWGKDQIGQKGYVLYRQFLNAISEPQKNEAYRIIICKDPDQIVCNKTAIDIISRNLIFGLIVKGSALALSAGTYFWHGIIKIFS
ncbi:macro domain-containing protein [Candidatus Dependentiae bacterium]|nr:macro domain-containing protein [Candidatus Dependentiae bacterium]